MLTWSEFRQARPDLADSGRSLFYQVGVGLAFLGTVSQAGRPRVRPMCPILTADGCMLTRTTGHGDPNPVHTIWRERA
jgi:hypothetical protein